MKLPPPRVARIVESARNRLFQAYERLVPAEVALTELIASAWLSQAIHAAAELGIADALSAGPLRVDDLAADVDADPQSLRRLLRLLSSRGIFTAESDDRFALNRLSDPLRSDSAVSVRGLSLFIGSPEHREHWSRLTDAIRTGAVVVPSIRGVPFFEYTERNPAFGTVFDNAMTSLSLLASEPILAAYDFSGYGTIVDVGGGHGRFLTEILARHPNSRGVLLDTAAVVAGADVPESRCTIESGSFFDGVPTGGDAYVLKIIMHDWSDDDASRILRNVREAMTPSSRLVLCEAVLPEGDEPHVGKLIDIEMLACIGGRERTEAEFRTLLGRSGFELTRVVPTVAPISVVEGRPVQF